MTANRRRHADALLKILRHPEFGDEIMGLALEEKYELLRAFITAFNEHRSFKSWKPSETWRSRYPSESARAFFERVYQPMPLEDRPYTHQLSNRETGDRPLYEALAMVITNNRRHERTGKPGSVDAARSLGDLFPMIGEDKGAKQGSLPQEFNDALAVMAQRLASARHREKADAARRAPVLPRRRKTQTERA